MYKNKNESRRGFTIVELLIVIVVIAILAAISIVAYNGIQDRARQSEIDNELATLDRAIKAARINEGTALRYITNSTGSGSSCWYKPDGTDLSALSKTSDSCWVNYNSTLEKISDASGIDVRGLEDPWGRPYYIDENEEEPSGSCRDDWYGTYARPFTTGQTMNRTYQTRGC